jgi:hypothetical protein
MLGVTFFGLLLTPVFYVLVRRLTGRNKAQAPDPTKDATPAPALASPEAHHA